MKKVDSQSSRCVGVSVGEIAVNYLHPHGPHLSAVFGLVRDDGGYMGKFAKDHNWSPSTWEALHHLVAAMEEDTAPELFHLERKEEKLESDEPPQF